MTEKLKFSERITEKSSGCEFLEIDHETFSGKVRICYVKVSDIQKIAEELARQVQDTSWIKKIDPGAQRSYNRTVADTAMALLKIFQETAINNQISSEFGELMVSIGSTKALEAIFDHQAIPIAELWKPQKKQNEGFDFHTVCTNNRINFGEAKFSSSDSPHGLAINQAKGFIEEEKHFRDRVHLINLVSSDAISNLDNDCIGIVASFSINAVNPLTVLKNALDKAKEELSSECIKSIYLVGVSN